MPLSQRETSWDSSPNGMPFGSPTSRRGIIKSERASMSPGPRTPNGRGGLPAPTRHDASSKKKHASTRLMAEEDLDDDDVPLKEEELQLVEQIIQESKHIVEAPDAELTPEVSTMSEIPATPPKRKRGRPRKDETSKLAEQIIPKRKRGRPRKEDALKWAEQFLPKSNDVVEVVEMDLSSEMPSEPATPPKRKRGRPRKEEVARRLALEPKVEIVPRIREKRAVVEKQEALRLLELEEKKNEKETSKRRYISDSGDSDDEFVEQEEPKPKRKYVRRLKTDLPPKERRSKKGRPSKQENVTKQVHSIFQMDDMAFFQDSIKSPEKTPKSPQKITNYLNFENTGDSTFSSVPTISGIRKPVKVKTADEKITKFEPMPVPAVDENGNVTDTQYMKKYFHGMDFDNTGRLTDERAFFLEGSEGYFEQHNLRFRPSTMSLTSHAPTIEYEEFLPMVQLGALMHHQERTALMELHRKLYHQWCFELSQGYSLNMYGVGSKMSFVMDFVSNYLLDWYEDVVQEEMPVVMVINGYNPSTKLKRVIHDIIDAVVTPEMKQNFRMPKHVAEALPYLLGHLRRMHRRSHGLVKVDLVLVVHNIDGEAFRDERSQNYLSQLASLPNVWFIASSDNVNSSLLWDLNRCKNFNFLWHDLTTYEPYSVEMSFKDVLSMGKSKKFLGTKGARYVLTSLSSRARQLYQILLQMQLQKLTENSTEIGRTGLRANTNLAVEMRALYDKCRLVLAVSNDIDFRNILREYVEHKMCKTTRNKLGTEVVYVPFSFDEMEKLLATEFGQ